MGYDAEKQHAPDGNATAAPSSPTPVPGKSTRVLASGSRPLPADVRAKLEAAFGRNFAGVRVHQDGVAAANGAKALTRGNDIHFAPGQFDPDSPDGIKLLAHELTHVVQQRQGSAATEGAGTSPAATPEGRAPFEAEANAVAERIAGGGTAGPIHGAVPFGTTQHEDQSAAYAAEMLRIGQRPNRPRIVPTPTVLEVVGDRFRVSFEKSPEYRLVTIVEYVGPLAHSAPLRLVAPPHWKSEDLDWNARIVELRPDGLVVDLTGDMSHIVDVDFASGARGATREHKVRTSMDWNAGTSGTTVITLPAEKKDAPDASAAELGAERTVKLDMKLGPDPVTLVARRFGDSGSVHLHVQTGKSAPNANLLVPVKGKGLALRILGQKGGAYAVDLDGDGKPDVGLIHTMRKPLSIGTTAEPRERRWHELRAYDLKEVRIDEAFFTVESEPRKIPDAVRADLHAPQEGAWRDGTDAPIQRDAPMEASQLRGRHDNQELRIDADGDRVKEMLLRFHWKGAELFVNAIQISSGLGHVIGPVTIPGAEEPFSDVRQAFWPVVEQASDGHAPMKINLFGDTRYEKRPTNVPLLVIHPPKLNDTGMRRAHTFEFGKIADTVGYAPEANNKTSLVGETSSNGMLGGVQSFEAELGELRDKFLFTLEYTANGLTFSVGGLSDGKVTVGGGARVHHDRPAVLLAKVDAGPSSIGFSIDGDKKADIVVHDALQATPLVAPSVEREHRLTIAGPAIAGDKTITLVCRGRNFRAPFPTGKRDEVLERESAGALLATETIRNQAAGGSDVEAIARHVETGLSQAVIDAANRKLISLELFGAWKTLSVDLQAMMIVGAKGPDIKVRGTVANAATTFYNELSKATEGKFRRKHPEGRNKDQINDYTGEETHHSGASWKTSTPKIAGPAASLAGYIASGHIPFIAVHWNFLRTSLERWAMYQLKETLGEDHSEVQNARYVSAMSRELNEIKGNAKVTRVYASFIPDDSYKKEANYFSTLPLQLYVWKDGGRWYIRNLTNPEKPFTEYVTDDSATAPHKLFEELNDKKAFPVKGAIRYQVPGGTGGKVVTEAKKTWRDWLNDIALVVALIGLALTIPFTAGSSIAVFGSYLLAASALMGAVSAAGEIYDDYRHGQLEITTVVLNVLQIISGLSQVGAIVAGNTIKAATKAAEKGLNWTGGAAKFAKFADKWYVPMVGVGVGADAATVAVMSVELKNRLQAIEAGGGDDKSKSNAMKSLIAQFAVMGGITALSIKGSLPEIKGGKVNIVLDTIGGRPVAYAGGVHVGGAPIKNLDPGDLHGNATARWHAEGVGAGMKGPNREWYEAWLVQKEKVTFDATGKATAKLPEIKGKDIPPSVKKDIEELAMSQQFLQEQRAFATADEIAKLRKTLGDLDIDPTSPIWPKERERLITQLGTDRRSAERLVDAYANARLGITGKEHAAQHQRLLAVVPKDEVDALARTWPEFEVYVTGQAVAPGKLAHRSVSDIEVVVVVPEGTAPDLINAIEQRAKGRRVRPDPDYLKAIDGKTNETLGVRVKVMTPDQMFGATTSYVKGRGPTALHRIDSPRSASGQAYTAAELAAFNKAGYLYDPTTGRFKPRSAKSQVPFGAPTGGLREPHTIIGTPLPSRAAGIEVLERLSQGESQVLRVVGIEPPPGMDPRMNEWGVGRRKSDGSYVLIKGEPGGVAWDHLTGIERIAHMHPLYFEQRRASERLIKGVGGRGYVTFDDLASSGARMDRLHVCPSVSDLAAAAADGGAHTVVVPYVHVGQGRIGNPDGAGTHAPVVFEISGAIPIAMLDGTPYIIYRARLRATSNGQVIGDAWVEGVQFGMTSELHFGTYQGKKAPLDPTAKPGMERIPGSTPLPGGGMTRSGGLVDKPVAGLYDSIDTNPAAAPKGWEFTDTRSADPDNPGYEMIRTVVKHNGKTGEVIRSYKKGEKGKRGKADKPAQVIMKHIELEGLEGWIQAGVPMASKGTPLSAYLTMRQMKMFDVGFASLGKVKMTNVRKIDTVLEIHRRVHPPAGGTAVTMEVAVRESASVQYARTPIEQSGHQVDLARVTWDGKAGPDKMERITVQELFDWWKIGKAEQDAYLARFPEVARSTEVLVGFDIHLPLRPHPDNPKPAAPPTDPKP